MNWTAGLKPAARHAQVQAVILVELGSLGKAFSWSCINRSAAHNGQAQEAHFTGRRMGAEAKEGSLADQSAQLILDALRRAMAEPAGAPLHGTRSTPGLFPSSATAKKAAQLCNENRWLKKVRTERHRAAEIDI